MYKDIIVKSIQLSVICMVFKIKPSLKSSTGKQTSDLLIIIINLLEVNEMSKVNHIDIINIFVQKQGCVNQIHEV